MFIEHYRGNMMRIKRLELLRDISLQLKWRLFTKFQHIRYFNLNFYYKYLNYALTYILLYINFNLNYYFFNKKLFLKLINK